LSVGVEEIDEQHKVLVDLLNEMHDAIHERRGSEVAREILGKLVCEFCSCCIVTV
jgi:hemerythrin